MGSPGGAAAPAPRRPPRVLIVTRTLDIGGTERHIAAIAPRLAAGGLDVRVVCIGKRGAQAGDVERAGVRVLGPLLPDRWIAASAAIRSLALASGSLRLLVTMLAWRPAIAHFFLPHAYIAGAIGAAVARVPIRIMSRRSQNEYQAKHTLMARLERALHGTMTIILGNSQRVVKELEAEGVSGERLGLIHNGIDLARYRDHIDRGAVRRSLGVPREALVLATVANLIPYKGHADLVAALGRIAGRLPQPWVLLAIGRDDGLGPPLMAQASALGIADNLRLLGERRDVSGLLQASDIGVLASHEEGFSNAVIEGMAAGLPMVVSDVGGSAEAVIDGLCGLVVPPRDPERLSEALVALACDTALGRRLGEAGRARAMEVFGLDTCVAKYASLYGALLAGASAQSALRTMAQSGAGP